MVHAKIGIAKLDPGSGHIIAKSVGNFTFCALIIFLMSENDKIITLEMNSVS